MPIDRSDGDNDRLDITDVPRLRAADAAGSSEPGHDAGNAVRVVRALEYRATVEAADRVYAIDKGCARVQEIEEKTVTPAMRRIEAGDPDRVLVGLASGFRRG